MRPTCYRFSLLYNNLYIPSSYKTEIKCIFYLYTKLTENYDSIINFICCGERGSKNINDRYHEDKRYQNFFSFAGIEFTFFRFVVILKI